MRQNLYTWNNDKTIGLRLKILQKKSSKGEILYVSNVGYFSDWMFYRHHLLLIFTKKMCDVNITIGILKEIKPYWGVVSMIISVITTLNTQ